MLWVRISIRARCTTLCDKVCQWHATGRWFSPCTPVSSTNKTDRHNVTEMLLKVALNTINFNPSIYMFIFALYIQMLTWRAITWHWVRVRVLMFNAATFNNISVILWRSVLLVEKTTDLPQVSDKLYRKLRHDRDSNSQL